MHFRNTFCISLHLRSILLLFSKYASHWHSNAASLFFLLVFIASAVLNMRFFVQLIESWWKNFFLILFCSSISMFLNYSQSEIKFSLRYPYLDFQNLISHCFCVRSWTRTCINFAHFKKLSNVCSLSKLLCILINIPSRMKWTQCWRYQALNWSSADRLESAEWSP